MITIEGEAIMKKRFGFKFSKTLCSAYAVLFFATCLLTGCDGCYGPVDTIPTTTEPYNDNGYVPSEKVRVPDYTLTSVHEKNLDCDLTPYKVFDGDLGKGLETEVEESDLRSFAREKLDYIHAINDKNAKGSFQGYEVEIVRINKFYEWQSLTGVKDTGYYSDRSIFLNYCIGIADGGALQEMICFDIYKDTTGRFILVTQCQDHKVISDFFEIGSDIQGGMVSTLPDGYEDFCKSAFWHKVCDEKKALTWAKNYDVVVFEDSFCTAGEGLWGAFCEAVTEGKRATILCAHYYSEDENHPGEVLYRAKMIFQLICFDGVEFRISTRNSRSYNSETEEIYKYLLRFNGENPETAEYTYHNVFILANNSSITWDDIMEDPESLQSSDELKYIIVYEDMYGEQA